MAKCFDVVGYKEPCNAVRQKYTGRALLMVKKTGGIDFAFSENGITVTNFDNAQSFFDAQFSGKMLPLSINAENPFGVTVQGNTDSGRVMYTKTIPVSIPATREGKEEEFIVGLAGGGFGYVSVALEVLGRENSVCDLFGAYSSVRIDPASVTRSEYENGGAWQFNLVCEEPVPNVICRIPDLGKEIDDALDA